MHHKNDGKSSDQPGLPYLPHRYIGLILAGLRPAREPLPGQPATEEQLLHAVTSKAGHNHGHPVKDA